MPATNQETYDYITSKINFIKEQYLSLRDKSDDYDVRIVTEHMDMGI